MNGPVDLFRSGELHSAIKGRGYIGKRVVSSAAFIQGSSAKRKFQYIQEQGIGPNRIKRRFLYLNRTEARRVTRAMINAAMTPT